MTSGGTRAHVALASGANALVIVLALFPIGGVEAIERGALDDPPQVDTFLDQYSVTHRVYSVNSLEWGGNYEVLYENDRIQEPVRITFTDADSLNPQVYMERNYSVVYVAWQEGVLDLNDTEFTIYFVSSNDNGTSWTSPFPIGYSGPLATWDMSVVDDWLIGSSENATLVEFPVATGFFKEAQTVFLQGYTFDTRVGEPELPPGLRIESYPPGVDGYYLVQVNGLVFAEWQDLLNESGAVILGYNPYLTYTVRMNNTGRNAVSALPFVRWVGYYHPAYRIQPGIENATGNTTLVISTFPGENVTAISDEVAALGAQILAASELEGEGTISVEYNSSLIDDIARVNGVRAVSLGSPGRTANSDARWIIQSGDPVGRGTPIHDHGIAGYYPGGGRERIAFADTGIASAHEALTSSGYSKVVGGRADWSAYGGANCGGDETGHGTAVAASIAGDAPTKDVYSGPDDNGREDGAAFRAQLVPQDIGCTGGNIDPPDDPAWLFYWGMMDYAFIHSNSWGTSHDYPGGVRWDQVRKIDSYLFSRLPGRLTVTFSADNHGPDEGTLSSEARAKNVITVGASGDRWNNFEDIGRLSSRGPSQSSPNNRLKPTIVAPGYGIWTGSQTLGDNCGVQGTGNTRYVCVEGTSFANAHVAGAVAMINHYFKDGWYPTGVAAGSVASWPSSALVRALLIGGAEDMADPDAHAHRYYRGWWFPNLDQGWGRINLDNSLYFAGDSLKLGVVDEDSGITTGAVVKYRFDVSSSADPLKVVLAWTDSGQDSGNLVNDLNLVVRTPSGVVYMGNNFFSNSWGSTSVGTADRDNNEEAVFIPSPAPGIYTVEIYGFNVPASAKIPSGGQPYALAVTGRISGLRAIGWQLPQAYAGTGTSSLDGTAVALYNINPNSKPDAFIAFVDDVSGTLRYRIAWDLNDRGVAESGWSEVRGTSALQWEVQGLGVSLVDINQNGIVDAFFLFIAALPYENLYYYRIAWDLSGAGWFSSWDNTNRGGWGTGSWDGSGGGVSIAQLGGGPRLDVLMSVVDAGAGEDTFRYRIAYDISNDGTWFAGVTVVLGYASIGAWETAGGDVSIRDINGNGQPDAVFAAIASSMDRLPTHDYRYRVAWDLRTDGIFASWSAILGFERTGSVNLVHYDMGLAVGSLNSDTRPDWLFVAGTGWPTRTAALITRSALDMSPSGRFP